MVGFTAFRAVTCYFNSLYLTFHCVISYSLQEELVRLQSIAKLFTVVVAIAAALFFPDTFEANAQTDSDTVFVKEIVFTGNTVIDNKTLQKATKAFRDKELTLEELGELTDLVTVTYQEEGYILARAYLPEQEIKDGLLTIAITEGKVGKILVTGKIHYREDVIKRYFQQQLNHGIVKESLLEKGLLLTNEMEKVKTDIILKEGEKPGEVDIVLNTKDLSKLTFAIDMGLDYNNFGSVIVSENKYGLRARVIDHNWGGVLSLRATIGEIYNNSALGNVDFSIPIYTRGTKLKFNYLKGNYTVGQELADLGLLGRTTNYGADISHPIFKKKNRNLTISFGYDHKYSESEILKQVRGIDELKLFNANIDFDNLDRFLGRNIVSLGYSYGSIDIDNTVFPSRLEVDTQFDRVALTLVRIQKIYGNTNIMLRGTGRISDERLLPIEQTSIGGFGSVRGHDPSLFLGDSGYGASAEVMFAPPFMTDKSMFGQRVGQMIQFSAFYDHGGVYNSKPLAEEWKNQYLSGYGGGIRLFYKDRFNFKYDLGIPVRKREGKRGVFNYFQVSLNFF